MKLPWRPIVSSSNLYPSRPAPLTLRRAFLWPSGHRIATDTGFLPRYTTARNCSNTPRESLRSTIKFWASPRIADLPTPLRLSNEEAGQKRSRDTPPNLRSGISPTLGVLATVATALILTLAFSGLEIQKDTDTPAEQLPLEDDMTAQTLPGRPGNLTSEQEEKLRQLWVAIFQVCGVEGDSNGGSGDALESGDKSAAGGADGHKKKRLGLFKKKNHDGGSGSSNAEPDKYGQTQEFQETLAHNTPEQIRETIWTMVKCDHPDALALRFLRARKWDVEKALVMMISTMNWRRREMHLDDDIMKNGEAGSANDEKDGAADAKKLGHDFMAQIRLGKSFLHGEDKEGRPICVVRVRLHKQGEQCEESLERYTVYIIETARMILQPPVDTATIVFDMTGFSMANMDYTPVKFMIKCFEANYPESLGAVLVHNAPWVFQGIWRIIRGWLDPVVAGKVHFTNNKSDLEKFIEPSRIIKELGGEENWEYQYEEPVAGENDKMKDIETRDRLLAQREELVNEFETETLQWIHDPEGDAGKKAKAKRTELATKLRADYWTLDPYVRARSLYDRQGDLQSSGKVDWYAPEAEKKEKAAAAAATGGSNGAPKTETSVDDLD